MSQIHCCLAQSLSPFFRDYENVTKMPTGVAILSVNYFMIFFASLDSRSSSSKAMTEARMASLLTRTA